MKQAKILQLKSQLTEIKTIAGRPCRFYDSYKDYLVYTGIQQLELLLQQSEEHYHAELIALLEQYKKQKIQFSNTLN